MNLSMKKPIPVFFAVDDRYAPFLSVAIRSMLACASPSDLYRIHVLNTGLGEETKRKLLAEESAQATISFDDVTPAIAQIRDRLHMRDYYSAATYYRIFIGSMYPQYDKVLYFDSDVVFCDDVAKLYRTDIGACLLGAVADDVIAGERAFLDYVQNVLGIRHDRYFNAGILLLNLTRYREERMEERFLSLLSRRQYTVAQDQDYLNVLCRDRVYYFDAAWNHSAAPGLSLRGAPAVIHYKMNYKPWHYDGVPFAGRFWHYAKGTAFAADIRAIRRAHTLADKLRDRLAAERLVALAREEADAVRPQEEEFLLFPRFRSTARA